MKTKHVLSLLVMITGIWGCSTSMVKSDFDQEVDFSKFRSFDWLEQREKPEGSEPFTNSLLAKRIRRAVDRELTVKGFRKDPGGNPDFKVRYYVSVKDKIDIRSSGYGYPWGYSYGFGYSYGGSYAYEYEEATLIIDVIDPAIDQLVWRGWYKDVLKDGDKINEEQIALAVNHVLKDFPPQ